MKTKEEILKPYKRLSNMFYHYEVESAMDEYASQFQQEWIPVEVRLPDNNDGFTNDTVLFTCGNVVRLGCYDYEDGFWHERYGGKYIDLPTY